MERITIGRSGWGCCQECDAYLRPSQIAGHDCARHAAAEARREARERAREEVDAEWRTLHAAGSE